MSSVRDRIRNLQQSASEKPTNSVAERARAVEHVSQSDGDPQKPLSQLKQKFDSSDSSEAGAGLGARVARFDSDASESLKDRVRRLESGASDVGSLASRASTFERPGSGVKDVAEHFAGQEQSTEGYSSPLHKARAMFEAGSDGKSVENTLSRLTLSSQAGTKGTDTNSGNTAGLPEKPSKPNFSSPKATSSNAAAENVLNRAAMFERAESEPQTYSNEVKLTQRDPPKSLPTLPPAQVGAASVLRKAPEPDPTQETNLKDELREIKRTNEELVSMLLELTSAMRRLEDTRDDLQHRITELEKR